MTSPLQFTVCLLILANVLPMAAHAEPKLKNKGFELGADMKAERWVAFGEVITQEKFAAKTAKAGVWMKTYSENQVGGFYQDALGIPTVGQSYTFSGWFKKEANAQLKKLQMKLEFLDASGKNITSETKNITTDINANKGDFTKHSVTGKAPDGAAILRVAVFFDSAKPSDEGAASLFFDDAELILSSTSDK